MRSFILCENRHQTGDPYLRTKAANGLTGLKRDGATVCGLMKGLFCLGLTVTDSLTDDAPKTLN